MPSSDRRKDKAVAARPWWLGAAVFAMGLLWLHGAQGIASTTNFIGLGPAAMIRMVGAGLAILGMLLILQALRGVPFMPQEEEGADAAAPPSRPAFLLALAGIAVPLATIRMLGFPLTAIFAFALVTHAFGSRRTLLDLAIGAVIGAASWYGFSLLGIELGPFLPVAGW
ncbi:tripartite tricarboxylate transporter TctB family protein [Taklimakanibacter lacteus]|uniref:tripartite tricarboxylate transporter TctB family protein n=1 Tax=Taklimakanibacter lacteus TaxID=2268456 RepID=UPI000E66AE6D